MVQAWEAHFIGTDRMTLTGIGRRYLSGDHRKFIARPVLAMEGLRLSHLDGRP
jgi:hypothetical protein